MQEVAGRGRLSDFEKLVEGFTVDDVTDLRC